MAQYLLFDLFKALDYIESSHKSGIFTRKDSFSFMHAHHILSYFLIISTMHFTHRTSKAAPAPSLITGSFRTFHRNEFYSVIKVIKEKEISSFKFELMKILMTAV